MAAASEINLWTFKMALSHGFPELLSQKRERKMKRIKKTAPATL